MPGSDRRMNLAVVGWCADSGVGRELADAIRNLPVKSAFILSNPMKPTRRDLLMPVRHFLASGSAPVGEMEEFLDAHRPDTILTWEVPGSWAFPDMWAKRGIKWVHVVHWDWHAPEYDRFWRKATLIAPNRMCQQELKARGQKSILLPVPVDTKRFAFRERTTTGQFISVYGYGGAFDRRSLPELFAAWEAMARPPSLKILAQKEPSGLSKIPPSVQIIVGNVPEPWNLYEEGDVAVQPSRYEGVGISFLEAQACGIPVVAVDAPPMNEIAPDLLVPVERVEAVSFTGKSLPSHVPSVAGLRNVIESLSGRDISELSRRARARVEKEFSWSALGGRWLEVLSEKAS